VTCRKAANGIWAAAQGLEDKRGTVYDMREAATANQEQFWNPQHNHATIKG
jgi:hypothetical protein